MRPFDLSAARSRRLRWAGRATLVTIARNRKRGVAPIEKPIRDHRRARRRLGSFSPCQWSRTRFLAPQTDSGAPFPHWPVSGLSYRFSGRRACRWSLPFVGPGLFGSVFHPIRRGCSQTTFASYKSSPSQERGLEPRIAAPLEQTISSPRSRIEALNTRG
jgi:hypothetical protein